MNKKLTSDGFGLIEVILSIALFSMTVTGLLAVLSFATGSTERAAIRSEAMRLAHEGMEAARSMRSSYDPDVRDSGLAGGLYGVNASDGLLRLEPTATAEIIGIFSRGVSVEPVSDNLFSVVVRIQWSDSTGHQSEVVLDALVSNWDRRM